MDREDIEDIINQVIQTMREIHEDINTDFENREDLQEACITIGAQVIEESGIDFSNDELADEHYPLMEIMALITSFFIEKPELKFNQINDLLWADNWVEYFEGSGKENLKKFFEKIKQYDSKFQKNKKEQEKAAPAIERGQEEKEEKKEEEKDRGIIIVGGV